MLKGTVLLTGGSGFLGRAILRRAQQDNWPCKFIVYSRDEMKQWEVSRKYPNTTCYLGDVARDIERLIAVMRDVDTVLHLAAVKFIPEAEKNVLETVEVNIDGSRNVIAAAIAAQVPTVVGISTDKACAPLNLYGMTKAVMERMFSEANRMSKTRFVTARYGNVVGSTGSVIPTFKKQIEDFGELRVTDPSMTRFWLSVDEAINLILLAHSNADKTPGWTYISECPAMSIVDLAQAVWVMERPDEHVKIKFTGIRPGEKLHESLFNEQEAPRVMEIAGGFGMSTVTEKLPEVMATKRPHYESSSPNHWVSLDEMISMVQDAETI